MDEIAVLKKEIAHIKARNKRVEREKAWETSYTRKAYIVVSTYVIISLVFIILRLEKPFVNAIIPSVAFFISTTSFGVLKKWWMEQFDK